MPQIKARRFKQICFPGLFSSVSENISGLPRRCRPWLHQHHGEPGRRAQIDCRGVHLTFNQPSFLLWKTVLFLCPRTPTAVFPIFFSAELFLTQILRADVRSRQGSDVRQDLPCAYYYGCIEHILSLRATT